MPPAPQMPGATAPAASPPADDWEAEEAAAAERAARGRGSSRRKAHPPVRGGGFAEGETQVDAFDDLDEAVPQFGPPPSERTAPSLAAPPPAPSPTAAPAASPCAVADPGAPSVHEPPSSPSPVSFRVSPLPQAGNATPAAPVVAPVVNDPPPQSAAGADEIIDLLSDSD